MNTTTTTNRKRRRNATTTSPEPETKKQKGGPRHAIQPVSGKEALHIAHEQFGFTPEALINKAMTEVLTHGRTFLNKKAQQMLPKIMTLSLQHPCDIDHYPPHKNTTFVGGFVAQFIRLNYRMQHGLWGNDVEFQWISQRLLWEIRKTVCNMPDTTFVPESNERVDLEHFSWFLIGFSRITKNRQTIFDDDDFIDFHILAQKHDQLEE